VSEDEFEDPKVVRILRASDRATIKAVSDRYQIKFLTKQSRASAAPVSGHQEYLADVSSEEEQVPETSRKLLSSRNLKILSQQSTTLDSVQTHTDVQIANLTKNLLCMQRSMEDQQKEILAQKEKLTIQEKEREIRDREIMDREATKTQAWNSVVDFVKEFNQELLADVHDSPVKRRRVEDDVGTFGSHKVKPDRLPWHEDIQQTLKEAMDEVALPPAEGKKDRSSLLIGAYLKPARKLPVEFFKPQGNSGSFYPLRLNANLRELSAGPLKDIRNISLSERELESKEQESREILVIHSHLLWIQELIDSLLIKAQETGSFEVLARNLTKIMQHQRSVNLLLTDRLATQLANAVLQRRDAHFGAVVGSIPKGIIGCMRATPILGDTLFDISEGFIEDVKEKRSQKQMLEALSQASQSSFKIPRVPQRNQRPGVLKDATSDSQSEGRTFHQRRRGGSRSRDSSDSSGSRGRGRSYWDTSSKRGRGGYKGTSKPRRGKSSFK